MKYELPKHTNIAEFQNKRDELKKDIARKVSRAGIAGIAATGTFLVPAIAFADSVNQADEAGQQRSSVSEFVNPAVQGASAPEGKPIVDGPDPADLLASIVGSGEDVTAIDVEQQDEQPAVEQSEETAKPEHPKSDRGRSDSRDSDSSPEVKDDEVVVEHPAAIDEEQQEVESTPGREAEPSTTDTEQEPASVSDKPEQETSNPVDSNDEESPSAKSESTDSQESSDEKPIDKPESNEPTEQSEAKASGDGSEEADRQKSAEPKDSEPSKESRGSDKSEIDQITVDDPSAALSSILGYEEPTTPESNSKPVDDKDKNPEADSHESDDDEPAKKPQESDFDASAVLSQITASGSESAVDARDASASSVKAESSDVETDTKAKVEAAPVAEVETDTETETETEAEAEVVADNSPSSILGQITESGDEVVVDAWSIPAPETETESQAADESADQAEVEAPTEGDDASGAIEQMLGTGVDISIDASDIVDESDPASALDMIVGGDAESIDPEAVPDVPAPEEDQPTPPAVRDEEGQAEEPSEDSEANQEVTPKKSNTDLAKEVLADEWGQNEDRKQRLTDAGYDYDAVQAEVNRILEEKAIAEAEKSPIGLPADTKAPSLFDMDRPEHDALKSKYGGVSGKLDRSELVSVEAPWRDNGMNTWELSPGAAKAFNSLNAEFIERTGQPLCIAQTYRSYDQQIEARQRHGQGAASPGNSNHGWGNAIDFCDPSNPQGAVTRNAEFYKVLEEIGPKHGFINPHRYDPRFSEFYEAGSKRIDEPWHWEYVEKNYVDYNVHGRK